MTSEEIVSAIQAAAASLSTTRLSIPAFRKQTGTPQSVVLRYFDTWSDACRAAGIGCGPTRENLIPRSRVSEDDCLLEMRRVATILGQDTLSTREFDGHASFTSKPVAARFGSWRIALDRAGLAPCEKAELDRPLSREHCIEELRRVATSLSTRALSRDEFDAHSNLSAYRVARALGGWLPALFAAGLSPSPNLKKTVALEALAADFLAVVGELERIPTLAQLTRRSSHAQDTYSRNRGGFSSFKRAAIRHLLATEVRMDRRTRLLLEAELARLGGDPAEAEAPTVPPHRQGRTLNFRGFVNAPTCENDVLVLFGAVAHELGFEILANRAAFPDCQARRRVDARREHYVDCLIEYEFSSADYRAHGHPTKGCDLIVCWLHNWAECSIEVLDLSEAIRSLDGWR